MAPDPRQALDIAKAIQAVAPQQTPHPLTTKTDPPPDGGLGYLFDVVVTDSSLQAVARKLFMDGHYARAVEEAYKCLNNEVKVRSGLSADGADLMRTSLSEKKPVIRLTPLKTVSEINEQNGYRDILAGAMTGIRNPRAHEHELQDHPERAVELLTLANHLMRKVRGAVKVRVRKA